MTSTLEQSRQILREELSAEASAGFPLLSKIPATHIVQFVDYCNSLEPTQQAALIDALVLAQTGDEPGYTPQPEIEQMRAVLRGPGPFVGGWRYTDIRFLHQMPRIPEYGGVDNWLRHFSGLALQPRSDLLSDTANFTPAKAPLLRKLVAAALAPIGFKASRFAGSNRYLSDDGVLVDCDFGARCGQLRWRIARGARRATHTLLELQWQCWEKSWCLPSDWNYLTEQNAERSVALLPTLIERTIALEDRLAMR